MEYDLDQLAEIITNEIIKRRSGAAAQPKSVLVLEGCPADAVAAGYEVKNDACGGYGYVLMTAAAYQDLMCAKPGGGCDANGHTAAAAAGAGGCCPECGGATLDMSGKRLLHERDIRDGNAKRGDFIKVTKRTIITALAGDYAKSIGVKIIRE